MKPFRYAFSAILLYSLPLSAQDILLVRAQLREEIKNWESGMEVPERLLSYPDGDAKTDEAKFCGFFADQMSVRRFVEQIQSDALLEELAFHPQSASATVNSAVSVLVERQGLGWFARRLKVRGSTRREHETLVEALHSRSARLSVAFIAKDAMPQMQATAALERLSARLEKGQDWRAAYRATAEEFPDVERRKSEPRVPTTLITYLFDGWVSEHGFDFAELSHDSTLQPDHLRQVFAGDVGGRLVPANDGTYLYFVSQLYAPEN